MGATEAAVAASTLRPVEIGALRQEIAGILREAIWSGTLKPAQRLNEQRLAEAIRVSRPPLREAIRILEQEGLVVSIPRRGTFVRTLTGEDILEIYTLRCALEGMAAELAIGAAGEGIDELEAKLARMEREEPELDLRAVIGEDLEFHRALVVLSGNTRLVSMWEQIAGQLRLALTLVDPAFFQSDYVESTHHALVAAIRNGDGDEVARLSRTLLDVGRDLSERWDEHVETRLEGREEEDGWTNRRPSK